MKICKFIILFSIFIALNTIATNVFQIHEKTIDSLETFGDDVIYFSKHFNINPNEVLICLDLDKTVVKGGNNEPLEGKLTKNVIKKLKEIGCPIMFLTARFDGEKLSNINDYIGNVKDINKKLLDLDVNINVLKQDSREFQYEVNTKEPEYGYLFGNVFYAGREKAGMLAMFLNVYPTKYKALFFVDDNKKYLDKFVNIEHRFSNYFQKMFLYMMIYEY